MTEAVAPPAPSTAERAWEFTRPRLDLVALVLLLLGLFLLPLLGLRYSRRTSKKLTRVITNSVLLLLSLGAIGTISGCGSGYFDHTYPITITATSNGIQHAVTVDFHIDQSPQ